MNFINKNNHSQISQNSLRKTLAIDGFSDDLSKGYISQNWHETTLFFFFAFKSHDTTRHDKAEDAILCYNLFVLASFLNSLRFWKPAYVHEQKNPSRCQCCLEFTKQPEKTSIIQPRKSGARIRPHSAPEQLPSHTRLRDYSEHIQVGLVRGLWISTLRCFCPSTGVNSAQPERPKNLDVLHNVSTEKAWDTHTC